MLTKNNIFQLAYILAVPFLIYNFVSCLQTVLTMSAGFTFLQMAVPVGVFGVILLAFGGYLKFEKELSLGLTLAGLVLVCGSLLRIFSKSVFVQIIIYGTIFLFLIGQYLYQNILIGQKFTKQVIQSFIKNALIFFLVIVAVSKITSFVFQSVTFDLLQDDNSDIYVDFIKGYEAIHPESANPRMDGYLAWKKFIDEHTQLYSSYFLNVSLCGIFSVLAFYLGCSLSSPVIATAFMMSGIMVYINQPGMGGLALQYGSMISMMYFLLALIFLLHYFYRQSNKQ